MKTLTKRATIYFDDSLHKALKIKAAETSSSISAIVNKLIKKGLNEDLEDLKAFDLREDEPSDSFENVISRLKADGKL